MDHIEQLKKIRSEAIARIRNSKDFKLAGKLGVLIVELGDQVDDSLDYDNRSSGAAEAAPFADLPNFTDPEEAVDEAELAEELASEIADIDEDKEDDAEEAPSPVVLGPFLNRDGVKSASATNGAAR